MYIVIYVLKWPYEYVLTAVFLSLVLERGWSGTKGMTRWRCTRLWQDPQGGQRGLGLRAGHYDAPGRWGPHPWTKELKDNNPLMSSSLVILFGVVKQFCRFRTWSETECAAKAIFYCPTMNSHRPRSQNIAKEQARSARIICRFFLPLRMAKTGERAGWFSVWSSSLTGW